jgi:hypothetical protein
VLNAPINQSLIWQVFSLVAGFEKNGQSRVKDSIRTRRHAELALTSPKFATTFRAIAVVGEAEGSRIQSAHLSAPRLDTSLHAALALDIRCLPSYVHL